MIGQKREAPREQRRRRRLETLLVHGAGGGEHAAGPTVPPVVHSTAFQHDSAESMEAVFLHREKGYVYSRLQNPTVEAFEARVTEICQARGTLAVSSGMTAVMLSLLGLLKAGDSVLVGKFLFGGTYTLFHHTLRDLGIEPVFFDPRDPAAAAGAVTERTRAVFLEAIGNPSMVVPDFPAYRALCERHGLPLVVDATLLTPCLFDAEALGADVAVFSTSKYFAGAATSIGGLVVDTGRRAWHRTERLDFGELRRQKEAAYLLKLRHQLMASVGPNLSPEVAFVQMMGLETLGLRLRQQCENARVVAEYLHTHPRVREVLYPGLRSSPDHDRARRLFGGECGSVLSFRLEGRGACFRALDALELIRRVANLGDTKTLALHPASTIYGTFWKPEQEELGVTEDMIRLSLGIEHPDDIIADLEQALGAA